MSILHTFISEIFCFTIGYKSPIRKNFIADYPETKSVQMYKNNIFEPLNLSSVGENSPLVEEKKIDFSLDTFKSNVSCTLIHMYVYFLYY